MPKLDRRHFLTFIGALGAYVTESSAIKIGQSRVYTGKDSSGRTVEVILSRSKKSLIALDGTCTHQSY